MALAQSNKITFVSPPVQGLNGRDPWYNMEPGYAVEMVNVEPRYNYTKCRQGFQLLGSVARNPTGSTGVFGALTLTDGTISFLYASTGGLYSITSAGVWTNQAAAFTAQGAIAQFRNTLHLGNNVSGPVSWNGTALTSPVAWTGPTLVDMRSPWVYKGRLYWLDATNDVWYGAVDAVSGALTKFPMQSYLTKGGKILFGGSTNNGGDQREALNVFVSTEGQVVVFSGQDPGASDWQLINTYQIGNPASYNAYFNYGEDFHIITQLGVVALSDILTGKKDGANYLSLSREIDPLLGTFYGAFTGSSGLVNTFPTGGAISNYENLLYLGPMSRTYLNGTSSSGNFVMNLNTKAWSWYQTPTGYSPATSQVSAGGYTYWVAVIANTSYQLWRTGGNTLYDVGASNTDIDWYSVSAFTNDRANYNKKLNKVRPISKNMLALTYGTYVDFDTTLRSNSVATPLTMNKKFYDINQEANFFALQVGGSSADTGATALPEYYGSFISYEPGSNIP